MQEVEVFSFLLEVVGVSIVVSLFATWIKLIPRYPSWKYALIQQLTNIGLQTLINTLMFYFGIYPSWLPLFAMILFLVWLSVRFTNNIVRKKGVPPLNTTVENIGNE